MSGTWKTLRRSLFVAGLMLLTSCQASDGPVSADDPVQPLSASGVELVPIREGRSLALSDGLIKRVSVLLGAVLSIDDVRLSIRPLSMSTSATITIEPLTDGTVGFRFGPSGLRFNPAARLTISADKANLSGIDPARLKIAGASDSGDDWQIIEDSVYDPATNSVSGPVDHFSRYALCVDR